MTRKSKDSVRTEKRMSYESFENDGVDDIKIELGKYTGDRMRKENAMARDKLCYQMVTNTRVNIGME